MNCSDAMFYPWWCGSRCYYYCKQRHNCHWRYFCYQQLLDDLSIPYFSSELHLFILCILLKESLIDQHCQILLLNWREVLMNWGNLEVDSCYLSRGDGTAISVDTIIPSKIFCSSHFDHFTKIEVLYLYHTILQFHRLNWHLVLLLIIVVEDLQIWILPPERGIGGAVGKLRPNINFCVPE